MELDTRKQLGVLTCVYLGKITIGYGFLWVIPMLFKIITEDESAEHVFSMPFLAIMMSSTFLGFGTGPFVTGFLANIKGRKPCFFFGGTCLLIAFLLKAASDRHWTVLHVARFFYGFGTGIVSVASIIYVGEMSSIKNRGKFLTGLDVFHLFGIIIGVSLGPLLPYYAMSCIGVILCACFMLGVCFIPESPLYLMMRGDEESIKKSLKDLGRTGDIDDALITKLEQLAVIKRKRDYWFDIFKIKCNRRALGITLVLIILQQAVGVMALAVIVQVVVVITILPLNTLIISILMAGVQIVAGCMAPFLVEFFGRKTMLTISTASCGLCLALMGTLDFIHFFMEPIIWTVLLLLIILLNMFMSFQLGFGKIPQTLLGEMFTPYVRSSGTALVKSINFLVIYLSLFAISYLSEIHSNIPFWIYSITCAGACAVTIFVVPETKGRTLKEIQDIMSKDGLIRYNKP